MLLELEERKVKVFARWAGIEYKKSWMLYPVEKSAKFSVWKLNKKWNMREIFCCKTFECSLSLAVWFSHCLLLLEWMDVSVLTFEIWILNVLFCRKWRLHTTISPIWTRRVLLIYVIWRYVSIYVKSCDFRNKKEDEWWKWKFYGSWLLNCFVWMTNEKDKILWIEK